MELTEKMKEALNQVAIARANGESTMYERNGNTFTEEQEAYIAEQMLSITPDE
jgi:hypothetical protein